MSDIETLPARLNIQMYVDCPKCDELINLLEERDTDGTMHNDDGHLLRQMFPHGGSNDDFECDGVVCTKCKTEFNVKELEW